MLRHIYVYSLYRSLSFVLGRGSVQYVVHILCFMLYSLSIQFIISRSGADKRCLVPRDIYVYNPYDNTHPRIVIQRFISARSSDDRRKASKIHSEITLLTASATVNGTLARARTCNTVKAIIEEKHSPMIYLDRILFRPVLYSATDHFLMPVSYSKQWTLLRLVSYTR